MCVHRKADRGAETAKAYWQDLRGRVIDAVERVQMSRRAAAPLRDQRVGGDQMARALSLLDTPRRNAPLISRTPDMRRPKMQIALNPSESVIRRDQKAQL